MSMSGLTWQTREAYWRSEKQTKAWRKTAGIENQRHALLQSSQDLAIAETQILYYFSVFIYLLIFFNFYKQEQKPKPCPLKVTGSAILSVKFTSMDGDKHKRWSRGVLCSRSPRQHVRASMNTNSCYLNALT